MKILFNRADEMCLLSVSPTLKAKRLSIKAGDFQERCRKVKDIFNSLSLIQSLGFAGPI